MTCCLQIWKLLLPVLARVNEKKKKILPCDYEAQDEHASPFMTSQQPELYLVQIEWNVVTQRSNSSSEVIRDNIHSRVICLSYFNGRTRRCFSPWLPLLLIAPSILSLSPENTGCWPFIIKQAQHLIINDCVPWRVLMNLLSHWIFPQANFMRPSVRPGAHPPGETRVKYGARRCCCVDTAGVNNGFKPEITATCSRVVPIKYKHTHIYECTVVSVQNALLSTSDDPLCETRKLCESALNYSALGCIVEHRSTELCLPSCYMQN